MKPPTIAMLDLATRRRWRFAYEQTIQSILTQDYPDLEYIIVDCGSTDGSVEIIRKYESKLHCWCSEPDDGQYDAINKGFCHSSGRILAWLNSDELCQKSTHTSNYE